MLYNGYILSTPGSTSTIVVGSEVKMYSVFEPSTLTKQPTPLPCVPTAAVERFVAEVGQYRTTVLVTARIAFGSQVNINATALRFMSPMVNASTVGQGGMPEMK